MGCTQSDIQYRVLRQTVIEREDREEVVIKKELYKIRSEL